MAFKCPFQLKWFCDALKYQLIGAPVQVMLKSLPMQLSRREEMWQKPFEMWCCKKYWFTDKLIAVIDVHCLFKHSFTEGFFSYQKADKRRQCSSISVVVTQEINMFLPSPVIFGSAHSKGTANCWVTVPGRAARQRYWVQHTQFLSDMNKRQEFHAASMCWAWHSCGRSLPWCTNIWLQSMRYVKGWNEQLPECRAFTSSCFLMKSVKPPALW